MGWVCQRKRRSHRMNLTVRWVSRWKPEMMKGILRPVFSTLAVRSVSVQIGRSNCHPKHGRNAASKGVEAFEIGLGFAWALASGGVPLDLRPKRERFTRISAGFGTSSAIGNGPVSFFTYWRNKLHSNR